MTTTANDTFSLEDLQRDIGEDITVGAPEPPSSLPPRRSKPMPKGNDTALDDQPIISDEIDRTKPWMKYHRLELVNSADKVRELVDRALKVGYVALDTETQGLDTRIEYRKDGSPYTRHSIIGYCLGLEGEGYYIPVRHKPESKHDGNPNVDSVEQTEAEIRRLCLAAQPVLKGGVRDILGAKENDFEVPPRVVIEFWHAKFDQEMLYPVTGIDLWNPLSFDDGMLMVYALDSEADQGLKENARDRLKPVADPETGELHPYEMIEFEELFAPGTKKAARKLEALVPRAEGEGHNVVLYGCSDAICTNLLCGQLRPEVQKKPTFAKFYILEKQVSQVVRIIERARVMINKGEIATLLQEADEELRACEKEIKRVAKALGFGDEFNPASSAQLADLLFGPKGVWTGEKPEKTSEGQYKTDEKTLEALTKEHPNAPEVFNLVLKHRRINKVRGTYLQNLANNTDELDQLRLNFRPTGAATGRFTAPKGNPEQGYGGIPIQGIPARSDPKKPKVAHSLRRMFIARPGYVIAKVDYASQELRIAASTSGEPKWIAEYEKELLTGEPADLHFLTAQAFYPGLTKDSPDYTLRRNSGKTANFSLVYGGGVGAVQRATGCDKVEGARMKAAFDASVPVFSKWVKGQKEYVKKHSGVLTGFKRFISIPDANLSREEVIRRLRAAEKRKKRLTDEQANQLKFSEQLVAQEVSKGRASAERKATNYPIQGSGADILKISLVLLLREFHLRGWLRNGGDDSVRIIMTVHDEIVFEIREERVAEAVPVITQIMEHPYRLAKWKVPLVAEVELGSSWAAKLKWASILKGETPRPPYLEGVEINPRAPVLVLGGVAAPTSPLEPKPLPTAVPMAAVPATVPDVTLVSEHPSPEPEREPETPADVPSEPAPSSPVRVEPNGLHRRRVAAFKLNRFRVDKKAALAVAGAMASAKIEGIRLEEPEHEMLVEFFVEVEGQRILLYSADEGYRVHVKELERNLRWRDLLDTVEEREELVAHA